MPTDKEIAIQALDFQKRAREFALVTMPQYQEWSNKKLDQGESEALIAHLDAMTMTLLPEEVGTVSDADFEEILAGIRDATT